MSNWKEIGAMNNNEEKITGRKRKEECDKGDAYGN